jgi:signal transduction histidine kinase/ActR/RegA family two-component response regulator
MRIRAQLFATSLALVLPLALVGGWASWRLAEAQKEAHLQRLQERVVGVRLALDTEVDATVRTLSTLAQASDTRGVPWVPSPFFLDRLQQNLNANPMWSSISVADANGRTLLRVARPDAAPAHGIDVATVQHAVQSRGPAFSNLMAIDDGRWHYTYIAVPMAPSAGELRTIYVAVEHEDWTRFLRRFPVDEDATLSLNDRNGIVVARTLNSRRWVGKPSRADYWQRTIGRDEDHFANASLEGESFFSAFSRLRTTSWVLGSGVPQTKLLGALRDPVVALGGGFLVALISAILLSQFLGRRVSRSLETLVARARDGAAADGNSALPLPIDEAETARQLLGQAFEKEHQARAQAERANRMKDQFLAMLAHELRNPLSAIRTATALLGRDGLPAADGRRAVQVLERQVGHMTGMIDEMLDAARLSTGKLTLDLARVDLRSVVQQVLTTFADTGRTKHLRVSSSLAEAVVLGEATRLEQVVSNLMDNACKFTPAGGTIDVALSAGPTEARLRIEDSGAGIDPALLPDLFEAFAQGAQPLDRKSGGLGLGLHVVRQIVTLHGGGVSADSAGSGQGTAFTVTLPLAPAAAAAAAQPARPQTAPLRVALVEDNEDIRDVAAALLRVAGHSVTTAADGHAGLALLRDDPPDVALVDLGLPGLDGLALAAALARQDAPSFTLLVALTGYGDQKTREAAREAGFAAFLQKPFDLDAFEDLVRDMRREEAADTAAHTPAS